MSLLEDILAAQNNQKSNPYSTAGGSSSVQSINNGYNSDLLSQLGSLYNSYNTKLSQYQNQLKSLPSQYQSQYDTLNTNKTNTQNQYGTAINTLNQSLNNAKTENQDVLNQSAVDLQTALKNITEQQANNGNLMSGQTPLLQLRANTARQNNDTKIYNQRTSDVNNYQTQIAGKQADLASALQDIQNQYAAVQSKQKADEDSINNTLAAVQNTGENDLSSLLSSTGQKRLAAIQSQQASEEAAAAAAAEKQYEAQLAASTRIQAAQISASRSGSSSKSKTTAATGINSALSKFYTTDAYGQKRPTTSGTNIVNYVVAAYPDNADQILSALPFSVNLYKGGSVKTVGNLLDYANLASQGWSGNKPKNSGTTNSSVYAASGAGTGRTR